MSSSIGSALKEARTKKTISLEEVHAKLRIHPRVLQLLEEDKFEKLPSPLFVKSFLKSYADFLEINSEELVSAYEKEKKEDPEQVLYIKSADPAMAEGYRPFHVMVGACAALLLLFVLVGHPSKMAKTLNSKLKKSTAKATTQEPKKIPEDVSSDWLNSPSLGNFPRINRSTPLSLEVKALDAVWVHVTCDGVVTFQGILKKGGFETWGAKGAIEIWTGNASNMALFINKNPLGSPGKGVVKKILISHDGVRIVKPSEH